jgi:hypothetical protein
MNSGHDPSLKGEFKTRPLRAPSFPSSIHYLSALFFFCFRAFLPFVEFQLLTATPKGEEQSGHDTTTGEAR